jgi:hypothetical protein
MHIGENVATANLLKFESPLQWSDSLAWVFLRRFSLSPKR